MQKTSWIDQEEIPISLNDQLIKAVKDCPDKTAIIFGEHHITYAGLEKMVDRIAKELIYRGVISGSNIFFVLHRRPDVIAAFLAIVRAGAVAVPFNFRGSSEEIEEIKKIIQPAGWVCHSDLRSAIGLTGQNEWILELDDSFWKDSSARQIVAADYPEVSSDSIVYLNLTSGSTGKPKAAMASQAHLYANTFDSCQMLKIGKSDIHLPLFAVMSHPHEIFCRALMTQGTVVLVENLYPRTIAKAISDHGITCIMAVTPVYELLLPFADNPDFKFSSLRIPECGGMNCPDILMDKFKSSFGVSLVPVWGSTETMGIAFASSENTPAGSVGKLLPSFEAKIVGTDSTTVKSGVVGELWLRGPSIMKGYYRSDSETQQVMRPDGWYCTGDLFTHDTDMNYYCHGRKDSMIKVGGLKVYPAEVEAVLFSHPSVREAVVVPFEDRLRGIVPLAAIVVDPGETLTEAQIKQFLRIRLARHKIPRIFRFLPALPRTAGGKIDRRAIVYAATSSQAQPELSIQNRIEIIDLKILHLLNERLKSTMELQKNRHSSGFHPDQIEETIRRLQEFNPGPLHDTIVEEIFRKILAISHYL